MKLFAICLVKNEEDIISQTLNFATQYCDRIYVIDNGSTDDTWKIVQSLSLEQRKIVPFEQTYLPYSDGLRARVYNQVHHELDNDDWWMILDSDEFLAEDPKPLIQLAMQQDMEIIRSWQIQFYFTDKDLAEWESDKDRRDLPIFKRRRYYQINWQEPRLFRNQQTRMWNTANSNTVPDGLRKVMRRRVLNRHYQFRDPVQIENRLRLRFGHPSFAAHARNIEWRSTIRTSHELSYYREGEPWEFKLTGVLSYYVKSLNYALAGKIRGARRKIDHLLRAGS